MAALTPLELQEFQHAMANRVDVVTWNKQQFNAALQAIEDRMRSAQTQNAIASDIETAVPGVFDGPTKQKLFGIWCLTAARRLGMA